MEPAGKAWEPAGWTSEPAGRASELSQCRDGLRGGWVGGREPAGRATDLAGRAWSQLLGAESKVEGAGSQLGGP